MCKVAPDSLPQEDSGRLREYTFRWYDEVWNERRSGAIDHFVDSNNESHVVTFRRTGIFLKSEFKEFHRQMLVAFPDIWFTVDEVIVDGDWSAARYHIEGTHEGEVEGFPATGRRFHVTGISMMRWQNGRIVESWINYDQLGLLRQIGFVE